MSSLYKRDGAVRLGATAYQQEINDTTKHLVTLSATCEAVHISSDADIKVLVGPDVVIGDTPVHCLQASAHHNLIVQAGSKILVQRHVGTGTSQHVHISELY